MYKNCIHIATTHKQKKKTIKAIGTTKPRYTYTPSFDVVALLLKYYVYDVICDENALEHGFYGNVVELDP